jgi:RNA polymerase sigma-70 factor
MRAGPDQSSLEEGTGRQMGAGGHKDWAELAATAAAQAGETWPGVRVDAAGLATHLAALWPEGVPPRLALGDLGLAFAALQGDAAAVREVSRLVEKAVRLQAAHLGLDASGRRELEVDVLPKLLVADPAQGATAASLAGFRGRGSLGAYLGVAVAHLAVDGHRAVARRKEAPASVLENLLAPGGGHANPPATTPESMVARAQISDSVKACLQEALSTLAHRDRVLLKLAYVQGLTSEQLGRIYSVDRATASRWLSGARDRLWSKAETLIAAAHPGMPAEDIRQLVVGLGTRMDLSLSRILSV